MVMDDSDTNVDDTILCDGNNNGYGSSGDDSIVFMHVLVMLVLVLMVMQVLVKMMIPYSVIVTVVVMTMLEYYCM